MAVPEAVRAGLAYRKDSPVNWCPNDQTVLANEQVVDGHCERCGAEVVKKKLTQWYFKITDYADRLLDDLNQLEGSWPQKVIPMQRNWIGRSSGADIDFEIEGRDEHVTVFSTRPDTLYGATFFVVAPDSDLAAELAAGSSAEVRMRFQDYLESVRAESDIERQTTDRPKTGVFLERYAINPVNGERLPIWAADYVLADYGHGAVMAVPAHDQRDLDFARAFDLPVRVVVDTNAPVTGADPGHRARRARAIRSCPTTLPLDRPGLDRHRPDRRRPHDQLRARSTGSPSATRSAASSSCSSSAASGRAAKTYRLRDWLISRQRYWGTPIPIIHCAECGDVPVPESELPVRLPDAEGLDLKPKGTSPARRGRGLGERRLPELRRRRPGATPTRWTRSSTARGTSCASSTRTTTRKAFDPARGREVGAGRPVRRRRRARHPAPALRALHHQGAVRPRLPELHRAVHVPDQPGHGASWTARRCRRARATSSSSRASSAPTAPTRCASTIAFAGPPEDDIDWEDVSTAGAPKFLARAWRISGEVTSSPDVEWKTGDAALRRVTHRLLADAPGLVEAFKFNVVVARLMELVNATRKAIDSGAGPADPAVREAAEVTAMILDLFAPYTAEDMWERARLRAERRHSCRGARPTRRCSSRTP